MLSFRCGRCGRTVFFENSRCESCGALLGYVPGERRMGAFDPAAEGAPRWPRLAPGRGATADDTMAARRARSWRPCAQRRAHDVCNWMLDPGDAGPLCRSCRLSVVIPDLGVPGHLQRLAAIEAAKRRLLFTLIELGLEPRPKTGPDDAHGLAFHLLASPPQGPAVLTGHANGIVTIDIAEADDVHREATRVRFGEPQRTLLGHLRHEIAHYLQYRWIADGTPAAERCREVFGDERADYAAALARYHAEGPPPGWQQRFVSAYASAHPWEDWAETCAHVLLVTDAVQTAAAWGLRLDGPAARARPRPAQRVPMDRVVLEHWLPVAQFLNAMNRSVGLPDSYPFLMPDAVLRKMAAVQQLLGEASGAAVG